MGTIINLCVGPVEIDSCKNDMGHDHGALFQPSDLTRRPADGVDYEWFAEHPEQEVAPYEAAFVRPLHKVLLRLRLLGSSLEGARVEYEAAVARAIEMDEMIALGTKPTSFMTFDEFCAFCCRHPLGGLDTSRANYNTARCDTISQGRFAALSAEIDRIPNEPQDAELFWSEASYFTGRVCILSPYSMLQVFGCCPANADVEVMWQFGTLVASGWADRDSFVAGAARHHRLLVATEGSTDARIIQRALELLRPELADFFRFVDVDEPHPFWGTGNLVKFAEGLVRIDVQNDVLFLLDNDAEGVDALRRIQALSMPPNMRAMVLPRHDSLTQFKARGPEGLTVCDINGRAAAIECYLDLNLPGYPPPEIVWTNYKKESGLWHGILAHKESYMRHFLAQGREMIGKGSYDASRLDAVLDALLDQAVVVAARRPNFQPA